MVNEIWTCWNCVERNAQRFNREDKSERKRRKIGISEAGGHFIKTRQAKSGTVGDTSV